MQAAEERYPKVYDGELEEFTNAEDMGGWCGHIKGGWRLHGKEEGSAQ